MKTLRPLLLALTLLIAGGTLRAQLVSIPDTAFGSQLHNFVVPNCMSGSSATGWYLDTSCADLAALRTLYAYSSVNISPVRDFTGIEYFREVTNLTIYNNDGYVASLPALPNKVRTLVVYGSPSPFQITSLPDSLRNAQLADCGLIAPFPTMPTYLDTLDVSNNLSLISLSALPPHMTVLKCTMCNLSSLPALPSTLKELYCNNNAIPEIPSPIPAGLTKLDCSITQVDSLPPLPASLTELSFRNNVDMYLHPFPPLPNSLKVLNCSEINWTSLPAHLPDSLVSLDCHSTLITSLPALPGRLNALDCSGDSLTALPAIPPSVTDLNCSNNRYLNCLPRVSSSMNSLLLANTGIQCLPNRVSATNTNTNLAATPLCDINSSCEFYYNIVGNVHQMGAATCPLDSLTPGAQVSNVKVMLKRNGQVKQQFYAFNSGGYTFKTDSLVSYEVAIDTAQMPLLLSCPASGSRTVALTAQDSIRTGQNFALECPGTVDFSVRSIVANRFRSSLPVHIQILAGNDLTQRYQVTCGAGTAGTVTVTLSGPISYLGPSAGALTPDSVLGNVLIYQIPDLNALLSTDLVIDAATDSAAQINERICINATINTVMPDANLANNHLSQCYNVIGSYDPNLKDVYPTTVSQNGDWLTYTIHFQNTGNDTAYTVVLRDTLDANVIPESFQYLAASHRAVVQLFGNAMVFTFPQIDLVDSATNTPLSEGWIQYKVRSKQNLPLNTQIPNTAYIYFDLNPAIATNTAVSTVGTVASCTDTTSYFTHSMCSGDSYTFRGLTYTTAGTYTGTLPRANGCDSIFSLALTVYPRYSDTLYAGLCPGGSYTFGGSTLTTAGVYTNTYQTVHGCDSSQILVLTTTPSYNHTDTQHICAGSSYTFGSRTLTTAGVYTDSLQSVTGCDSILILDLRILPAYSHRDTQHICAGSSYTFAGRTLTVAGVYTDSLQTVNGCDSLRILDLRVDPLPSLTWNQTDTFFLRFCDQVILHPSIRNAQPAGGAYSGSFVVNDSVITPPAAATINWPSGSDTVFTITYTYSNGTCTNTIRHKFRIGYQCEGVNDLDLSDIRLYPNPNGGSFVLETTNATGSEYQVYDMVGSLIAQGAISTDHQQINMTDVAAGVYTLQVRREASIKQLRLVIEK